jgi:ABC-type hemin transport system substrate-binding protein
MKLNARPDLVPEYIERKTAEVLAVDDVLKMIAKAPATPPRGAALTPEKQKELRAQNAELRAWHEKRRIFMDIKGGTAAHSSEQ